MQIATRQSSGKNMVKNYAISIYLDTRRAKVNGKFPVKLRVYTSTPRRQKLIPTKYEFTEKEFDSVWNTVKTRSEYQKAKRKLQVELDRANDIAEGLNPFSLDAFEKQLFRNDGDVIRVVHHYEETIETLTKRNRIGTANNYTYSQRSLAEFMTKTGRGKFDNLPLFEITPDWLTDYEHFMVEVNGRSVATVGIHLRPLRAIFNKAIDEKVIDKDLYPFGKRKYQIPSSKKVKKALSGEQLRTLFNAEPRTELQQQAKDFWFFSYFCNGMNTKDIAELRYKDIKNDTIHFIRAKTQRTSKTRLKPITVYLNDYALGYIKKYGNEDKSPESLVFDIINDSQSATEQHNTINNFNRIIGQHLKQLCLTIGLPSISPYWARHSFATNAIRKGASMEFMQESLGHLSKGTTQDYFAGFDDETKKEFAKSLMEFV